MRRFIVSVIVLWVVIALVACTGAPVVNPDNTIGTEGGEVAVDDPNSPINGTKVVIPAEALAEEEHITLSITYRDELPAETTGSREGTLHGKYVVFETDKTDAFERVIEITLPIDTSKIDEGYLSFPRFWNEEKQQFYPTEVTDISTETGTIKFIAVGFRNCAVFYEKPETSLSDSMKENERKEIRKEFNPKKDGFSFENPGTIVTPDGACFGMAWFAKYYWDENYDGLNGPLYDAFGDYKYPGISYDQNSLEVAVQMQKRLKQYGTIWENTDNEGLQIQQFEEMIKWLDKKHIVNYDIYYREDANGPIVAHVLTVFGYERVKIQEGFKYSLRVYDSNIPGYSIGRFTVSITGQGARIIYEDYPEVNSKKIEGAFPYFLGFMEQNFLKFGSIFQEVYNQSKNGWQERYLPYFSNISLNGQQLIPNTCCSVLNEYGSTELRVTGRWDSVKYYDKDNSFESFKCKRRESTPEDNSWLSIDSSSIKNLLIDNRNKTFTIDLLNQFGLFGLWLRAYDTITVNQDKLRAYDTITVNQDKKELHAGGISFWIRNNNRPTIEKVSPLDSTLNITPSSPITLYWRAKDEHTMVSKYRIVKNGVSTEIAANTGLDSEDYQTQTYTYQASNFTVGNNTVQIFAIDSEGAESSVSIVWNIVKSSVDNLTITQHPQSQTKTEGESVTFNVVASGGTPPYSYQWRKNGTNINGATSQSYTKNNLVVADAGQYSVVVTDSSGVGARQSVTSNNAQLTVNQIATVTITAQSDPAAGGDVRINGGTWGDSKSVTVNSGTQVTMEAAAASGYTFDGWYDGSAKVSSNTSYQVTATANKTYKARFSEEPFEPAMVLVESGTFQMGNTRGDPEGQPIEVPVHTVTLTYDYWIGKYEVTFAEYDAFCNATGRSKPGDHGWGRGTRPVILVSRWDAIAYCNWLSEKEGIAKAYDSNGNLLDGNGNRTTDIKQVKGYRLPTEAEWEYAARGGHADIHDRYETNDYKYAGSNTLSEVGWYDGNSNVDGSGIKNQPVGQKKPNELGLYDMTGNVCEWCHDWWGGYASTTQTNPTGPSSGTYRVLRGGSWRYSAQYCRVANRGSNFPSDGDYDRGFRLSRTSF